MVSLLLALAFQAASQTADLSQDPRLQQTLDIHLKRASIAELEAYLKQHTDQHFAVEGPASSLMVCAFAKKQPLWKVMKGVASVLGCNWEDLRSEWKLKVDPLATKELYRFTAAENSFLRKSIFDRAKALGEAVGKGKFDLGGHAEKYQEGPEDIAPGEWAKRMLAERAYYAAGVMFRTTPALTINAHVGTSFKLDSPEDFTSALAPQGFKISPPESPPVANLFQKVTPDPAQPGLTGTQILVRVLQWAGTIEAVEVPPIGQVAGPKNLAPVLVPKGDLAKTEAGKWILGWENNLSTVKEPWLDQPVQVPWPKSDFYKGACGIEEFLEAFHNATGQTVISDAFRVPVAEDQIQKPYRTCREWLQNTREREKCFVQIEDGVAEVRHGGFWDLRSLEPDEDTIRSFESVRDPDLIDYADFAILFERQDVGTGAPDPFFDFSQAPVVRFDPRPFQKSFNTLLAFGQLLRPGRVKVLTGKWYDTFNLTREDTTYTIPNQTTAKSTGSGVGKLSTQSGQFTAHMAMNRAADLYLNASARYGPFFGTPVQGLEPVMMESLQATQAYLNLSGRFPVTDLDEVPLFTDDFCQAHLFNILSPVFQESDLKGYELDGSRDKKVCYGKLTFWAGFSQQDGVIEVVDIPDPRLPK